MPYVGGTFTLPQDFGTGVAPDNQLPPKLGDNFADIATALSTGGGVLLAQNNLSDLANVSTAVSNLGLVIGTDVLAFDAQLTAKIRMNSITTNTTLALTDAEKCILVQGTTAAQTITIPAFATIALGQGTAITVANFSNQNWSLTPAGGVTLNWAPTGGTGTRIIAANGLATILALFNDFWVLSGSGIT